MSSSPRKLDQLSNQEDTAHLRKTKRTKTSSACDACRKRRSRCELVEEDGCHRCRVLGTDCSLRSHDERIEYGGHAEEASEPSRANSPVDHQSTLMRIERRTAKMEQLLTQLTRRENAVPLSVSTRPWDDDHAEQRQNVNWTGAVWQILGGVGQLEVHTLLDPVKLGLISESFVTERLADISTILAPVLPIQSYFDFLHPSKDPLLRCAILRINPPPGITNHLDKVIHRNLQTLSLVPPNRQNLIALLILSYSTASANSPYRSCDPYNVSNRLSDLAISLGLDERGERLQQEAKSNLCVPYMQPLLSDTFLWYTCVHRAALYTFFTAPSCSLRARYSVPSVGEIFPFGLAQSLGTSFYHLVLEGELLEIFQPPSDLLRKIRTARIYEESQTISIIESSKLLSESLILWREKVLKASLSSSNYLIIVSLQMEMAIYLRGSSEAGPNLPTPLGFERRSPIIPQLGNKFVRAHRDFIQYVLDNKVPIEKFPSWNFIMSFLPYATYNSIKQLHGFDHNLDITLLDNYRNYLLNSHPIAFDILKNIDNIKTPHGWKDHSHSIHMTPDTNPTTSSHDPFAFDPSGSDWWALFDWLPPFDTHSNLHSFSDLYDSATTVYP